MNIKSICQLVPVFLLLGCQQSSERVNSILQEQASVTPVAMEGVAYEISTEKSRMYWKGTKLFYTRSHEGVLKVKQGTLMVLDGKLVGGQVVMDMNSLQVTDIPTDQPVPLRNLTRHLKEEFEVAKFSDSTFDIISTHYHSPDSLTLLGNLQIKEKLQPIEVTAIHRKVDGMHFFESGFILDRFAWDIGSNGSWLEKRVVDREMSLRIKLVILK